jgi:hypothetical protein
MSFGRDGHFTSIYSKSTGKKLSNSIRFHQIHSRQNTALVHKYVLLAIELYSVLCKDGTYNT